MNDSDKIEDVFQTGLDHLNQKNFQKACKAFEKVTQKDPTYALAWSNWGLVLHNLKQYEDAIPKYEEATRLDPKDAITWYNWGLALLNLKQYKEAIPKYEEATRLDPKNAITWSNWGLALHNLKQYKEAIPKYEEATRLDPKDALAWSNWGSALHDLKQYEEAILKYEEATRLDPTYAIAWYNWGLAFHNQNRYEEAIEKYEKAKQIDNIDPYSYHNIGIIYSYQGNYEAAREEYAQARDAYYEMIKKNKMSPDGNDHAYLGEILLEIFGELEATEEIYLEGLKRNREDINALNGLVKVYLEKKEIKPDEKSELNRRSEFHAKARRYFSEGVRLLKKKLKVKKEIGTVLDLSDLYIAMREYREAKPHLLEALKMNKDSDLSSDNDLIKIFSNLGIVCVRTKKYKKAIEYFESSLRIVPDDLVVRNNLAETYFKAGQLQMAEAEYKEILGVTDYHVESHIGLGEVYTALGDAGESDYYESAINNLNKALKIFGNSNKASKQIKEKDKASLHYLMGYVQIKQYESSVLLKENSDLLKSALDNFTISYDHDFQKAKQAKEKLNNKMNKYAPQRFLDRFGTQIIVFFSILVFIITQASFLLSTKIELGGYYSLLTFGSLVFIVVGLYLPQILKLKVGAIELEKSSIDQIKTPGSLGIKK